MIEFAQATATTTAWNVLVDLWLDLLGRLPYIGVGLVVFAAFWLVGRLFRQLSHTLGRRTALDPTLAQLLGRLASAGTSILGVLVAAVIIFPTFRPGDLIAGLGITTVAIGFAFKDILQNFFAGILILWRRPFTVGDQIRTGEFEGTVVEINVRSTRLKTYDGERAVLPNADVYTKAVLVRTAFPHRRVTFTVGIGYPDSIEQARSIIQHVLFRTEGVLASPAPWVYVNELAPSSVNLMVYFWTGSQQAEVLRVRDRVVTGIKLALDQAGIDMPFPHQVVLFHDETVGRDGDIDRTEYLQNRRDGAQPQGPR